MGGEVLGPAKAGTPPRPPRIVRECQGVEVGRGGWLGWGTPSQKKGDGGWDGG